MPEIMQYATRDSTFHRLHPLTKLISVIAVVALAVLTDDIVMLAVLAGLVVLTTTIAGLGHYFLRQIPLLLMLTASLLALTILFIPNGEILCFLIPSAVPIIGGALPITTGAIDLAIAMSLRFVAMIFAFQALIISTQPRDLVNLMDHLRVPIDYTLIFLIALRFIPSLQLEGKRIHEAQLARAYSPGRGPVGKLRGLLPILIPLVTNSLGRTMILGLTIDLRGYRSGNRMPMRNFVLGKVDIVSICCVVLLVVGYLALLAV